MIDEVRFATLDDLPYIVDLSRKESLSIGFIPKMAYESAITGIKKGKRWSDVCNDRIFVIESNETLVGFCLASFGRKIGVHKYGKIAQICLQSDARKIQRGKELLCHVLGYAASQGTKDFQCGCADDLESNLFWLAMGWQLSGSRKGIAYNNTWKETSKRTVNIYTYFNPEQSLLGI